MRSTAATTTTRKRTNTIITMRMRSTAAATTTRKRTNTIITMRMRSTAAATTTRKRMSTITTMSTSITTTTRTDIAAAAMITTMVTTPTKSSTVSVSRMFRPSPRRDSRHCSRDLRRAKISVPWCAQREWCRMRTERSGSTSIWFRARPRFVTGRLRQAERSA